jgi:crotonobetainyl-CoA:carnitine CoA-transferase CaiB-like acyl-CoA transferase
VAILTGTQVIEMGTPTLSTALAGLILRDMGATVAYQGLPQKRLRPLQNGKRHIDSIDWTAVPDKCIVLRHQDYSREPLNMSDFGRYRGRLVICEITGRCPASDDSGGLEGRSVEAGTGLMFSLSPYEGNGPVYPVLPFAATGAALIAAFAGACGLLNTESSRPSRYSVSEATGSLATQILRASFWIGKDSEPSMERDPVEILTPTIRSFEVADGQVLFSAPSRDAFIRAAEALGFPELSSRFPGAPWDLSTQERQLLRDELVVAMRPLEAASVVSHLEAAGVSVGRVGTSDAFTEEEHVKAVGALIRDRGRLQPGPFIVQSDVSGHASGESYKTPRVNAPGLPLQGVRVVELATFVAGPYAGTTLAAYGAEVIKVEAPPSGDPQREDKLPFAMLNHAKHSEFLDLGKATDHERLIELIRNSDVFLSNMRQGGLRRFGLDFESLARLRPGLVYAWVSGWGSGGPRSAQAGVDPIYQAMSGIAVRLGGYSGWLRYLPTGFIDDFTGLFAATAICAALGRARESGMAQLVEASLLRSAIFAQLPAFISSIEPEDYGRDPVGPRALDRIYEVGDGYVYLRVSGAKEWRELGRALDQRGWAVRFASALRDSYHSELAAAISTALRTRTQAQAISLLHRPGAIVAVRSLQDLVEKPELRAPLYERVKVSHADEAWLLRPFVNQIPV